MSGKPLSFRHQLLICPACEKRNKAVLLRFGDYEWPICYCRSTSCALRSNVATRKAFGREEALKNSDLEGIRGRPSRHISRNTAGQDLADLLARRAHQNRHCQRMDADGLENWARSHWKGASDKDIARFLDRFWKFEDPGMRMDLIFAEAARVYRAGGPPGLEELTLTRRAKIVASVAYVMSLFRGQSRKVSFTSRLIEKHFVENGERQIDRTSAADGVKELVRLGVLVVISQHQFAMRKDGSISTRVAAVHSYQGPRPFDGVAGRVEEGLCENLSQADHQPTDELSLAYTSKAGVGVIEDVTSSSDCGFSLSMSGQVTRTEKFTETQRRFSFSRRDYYD
ncbi:hypothetical protein [Planctomicrobium piriforme]|uniref:Uncharacterized protein n=1 Tax=Planctomicrobium piriforme TaxID=1576369 RepID=A0A1I3EAM5_9PLAN|nr:hypothetical protein [Planctomicrobium piriforme]SFH96006.1 hypothetical protein SAMN05421753_104143 [Planctomicrobium piriforme]